MKQTPAGFRAALGIGWAVLAAAGFLYARAKGIGFTAALPVVAAFLITYPFYLAMGFRDVRESSRGSAPSVVSAGVGRSPISASVAAAPSNSIG